MLRNTLAGSKTVVSISRDDPVYIYTHIEWTDKRFLGLAFTTLNIYTGTSREIETAVFDPASVFLSTH